MTTELLDRIILKTGSHTRRGAKSVCATEDRERRTDGTFAPTPLSIRFWSRVEKTLSCWLWLGTKSRQGYGSIQVGGKMLKAHRVAWELTNGPIPRGSGAHGTCVLHRCDNPSCVNPEHLFLGSNRDNAQDRQAKGRTKNLDRLIAGRRAKAAAVTHCPSGHPYNSANTGVRSSGAKWCRTCARERTRSRRKGTA